MDAALREAFTGAMLGKGVTLAFLGNLIYDLDVRANRASLRSSPSLSAVASALSLSA